MMDPNEVLIGNPADNASRTGTSNAAAELVLKGISEGITDPDELKKLAGIKRSADLFVTMDRLALRKEFHRALAANGLTIDRLVSKLSSMFENTGDDRLRLEIFKVIARSLSVDRPDSDIGSGGSWEDVVMEKALADQASTKRIGAGRGKYEIPHAPVPPDMQEMADRIISEGRGMGNDEE